MLSVLTSQEDGLLVHYGPTLNSPMSREGNQVTLDNVTFDTFVDWNYRHVSVLYRVQFPLDTNTPAQVWYYVEDNAVGGEKNLRGWIAVQMEDKFYIEGAGIDGFNVELPDDVNSDPCKGYIPTVNDPDDPDFTFTFYYDREMAADYAIAQSYQIENYKPHSGRITYRLDPSLPNNHFPTALVIENIPFANIRVATVNHNNHTGSAAFVSEGLFMGGMPQTVDLGDTSPDSCSGSFGANSGWRHCITDGNTVWLNHPWIVAYYTNNFVPNPSQSTTSGVLTQQTTPPTERGHTVPFQPAGEVAKAAFLQVTLDPPQTGSSSGPTPTPVPPTSGKRLVNLTTGEVLLPDDLLDLVESTLVASTTNTGLIQAGDYAWINPLEKDPHGLLVAGWGNAEDCGTIIENPGTSNRVTLGDGKLFATYEEAINASVSYPVPYVVDFSYRIQHPIPRPFYCTRYVTTTSGWEWFANHEWHFFTLPEAIHIPVQSLHVQLGWIWANQDGTCQPNGQNECQ